MDRDGRGEWGLTGMDGEERGWTGMDMDSSLGASHSWRVPSSTKGVRNSAEQQANLPGTAGKPPSKGCAELLPSSSS